MSNKSPAFQFYPADFLSGSKVILMSNEAVGCYIKLICHGWLEGAIPSDINAIARLCFCHSEKMATLWEEIKPCYTTHPKDATKLIHPRLEKERKKQGENKKKLTSAGKRGAKARWQSHTDRKETALAKNGSSTSSSSSTSTSVKKTPAKKAVVKKEGGTDTAKAVIAWANEYKKQIGEIPDIAPARDHSIIKVLVENHGLERVLRKIPYHISERKLLSIPGFKTCFNTLGVSGVQTRGAKKKQALENMAKELEEGSGEVIEMAQPRRINA